MEKQRRNRKKTTNTHAIKAIEIKQWKARSLVQRHFIGIPVWTNQTCDIFTMLLLRWKWNVRAKYHKQFQVNRWVSIWFNASNKRLLLFLWRIFQMQTLTNYDFSLATNAMLVFLPYFFSSRSITVCILFDGGFLIQCTMYSVHINHTSHERVENLMTSIERLDLFVFFVVCVILCSS